MKKRITGWLLILVMILTMIPFNNVVTAEAKTTIGKVSVSSVSKTSATTAIVKWKAVKNADGYEVYTKTGKEAYKLAGVSTTNEFKGTRFGKNKKVSVKVRAFDIDSKGNIIYGAYSKELVVDMKGVADVTLKSVKQTEGKKIKLIWTKTSGAKGYYIYRKDSSKGSFKKIATVKGAGKISYTDKNTKYGKKYTYAVKAYSGKKISKNYAEKSVSISYLDDKSNYGNLGLEENRLFCNISGAVVGSEEKAIFEIYYKNKPLNDITLTKDGENISKMTDDGQNGDRIADDGVYSCAFIVKSDKKATYKFVANNANTSSNIIEINVYDKVTETEVNSTTDAAKKLMASADKYLEPNGKIKPENLQNALDTVYNASIEKQKEVNIKSVTKNANNIRIVFNNGLSYVFTPEIEGMDASGDNVSVSIWSMQPWKTGYITQRDKETAELDDSCTDGASKQIADKFSNYTWEKNLDDSQVTLDAIKSFGANQVIFWHGHGNYDETNGEFICTGEDYKSEYIYEWLAGILERTGDGKVAFYPAFIDKYVSDMSNSLVYMATCESGHDSRLANSFLNKGAAAFVGNNKSIDSKYNCKIEKAVADSLIQLDNQTKFYNTLGQSLTYAKEKYGKYDNAYNKAETFIFTADGKSDYRLSNECQATLDIDKKVADLKVDDKLTLTATTDGDPSYITWSSSDETVASVNGSGATTTVTANGAGTATITCMLGDKSVSCKLNITKEIIPFRFYKTKLSGKEGGVDWNWCLNSTGDIKWSVDDPSVVKINYWTNGDFVYISYLKPGTATLTCAEGDRIGTIPVNVTGDQLKLDVTSLNLNKGSSSTITATTNASDVTWSTSNANIVTVTKQANNQAKITGKAAGTATVTCKAGSKTVTCKVTVKNVAISLKLDKTVETVGIGQRLTVTAITNAETVEWSLINDKAKIVSKKGKSVTIEGVKTNLTFLFCKAGTKSTSCQVYVTSPLEDGRYTSLLSCRFNKTEKTDWGSTIPAFSQSELNKTYLYDLHYGAYAETDEIALGKIGKITGDGNYYFAIDPKVKIYQCTYTVDNSDDEWENWDDDEWENWDDDSEADDDSDIDDEGEDSATIYSMKKTQKDISFYNSWFQTTSDSYKAYKSKKVFNRGVTFDVKNQKIVAIYCWEIK